MESEEWRVKSGEWRVESGEGKLSGTQRNSMRAGRPRSRGDILHTKNREHPLHHARESGKALRSALKNHSPLEGESASF